MKNRNPTIMPFIVFAACLLLTVVAMRSLSGDASETDKTVYSHAKAMAGENEDPPEISIAVRSLYSQTPNQGGFVSFDFNESESVIAALPGDSLGEAPAQAESEAMSTKDVASVELTLSSLPPIENDVPLVHVVAEANSTDLNDIAVAIPTLIENTADTIELADNLELVIESPEAFDGFLTNRSFTSGTPIDSAIVPPEDRFAALPQTKDKPRFKKFGAPTWKTKDNDEEDTDEEEEDQDPPTKQPAALSASNRWKLAGEPKQGDRYKDDTPLTDDCSIFIEDAHGNFSPTPTMPELPYDPCGQMNVYEGKQLYANQRPLLELGRPWYQLGPISEGSSFLGFHNHVNPQYLLFGDARTGFASNRVNGDTNSLVATQLNLIHHLKVTSTERFVAGMTPLGAAQNTRYNFDNDEAVFEGDADFDFAYFEGDIGAITGGAIGKTLPFDLPFAAGVVPLVFQNGIWMEDEILGFAVTIPARNSPRFDISNMDITFFAGYDRIDSPAFQGDNSAARVMGIATFIEALNGYFEVDYAFLDDRTGLDRSYHNMAVGYTRRYGRFLSNSTRVIVNAGQQSNVPGTADGVLLLSENSLITGFPSTVVPYFNMFAGFDRPQSVGRNVVAGGILRNTGILFESDNLTGYPTLDDTANDTFGMALGLNLLADEFAQQLIVEAAALGVMGDDANRNARGDQYGVGVRYQLPLTNSVIFRADAMAGFLRHDEDINGARMEIRKKF